VPELEQRALEDLSAIEPGQFLRIVQQVQMEGLLWSPSPDRVFWGAVDRQREEFGKLGYLVVLDRELADDPTLPATPFARVTLAQIGGPISGWIPVGDGENGEPAYEMYFQWLLVEVADPDPEVLLAGWPIIAGVVGVIALLLLGTAVVIWQTRVLFVESGDDLREIAREGTTALAVLAAATIAVILLTR